jgi:hypothetical protein
MVGAIREKGFELELSTSTHEGTADLAWLAGALEHARSNGQPRVVGYLEAVLDDVVFEMESVARR